MIKRFLIGFTVLISAFLFTNKVSAAEPITTVGTSIYNLEDCTYFTYTEEQIENLIQSAKLKLTELGYNADEFNKFNLTVHKASYGIVPMFLLFNDLDIENNNYRFTLTNNAYAPISVGYSTSNGRIRYMKTGANNPSKITSSYFFEPQASGNSSFKYYEANDSSGVYILTNFDLKNSSGEVIIPQNYNTEPKDPAIDTVNKVITIPIDYFYNDGNWQNYYLYFASPTINNMNYSLTFSYENNLSGLPSLPVELIINDKVENVLQHLADIQNSKYTAENGFGGGFSLDAGNFGGGGGGGRFDDDEPNSCMSTQLFTYNGSFPNENIYGLVALSLNSCADLTGKTPDDFSTKSIKISYDARIIDLSTDPSGPSSDAIGDMLEDIRNEYELEQEEEIKFEIFQPILKSINDKLPIINQFSQILNQFNFDEEINEPPVFKVNIPYFNLNDIEVFNFQFFIPYRDYVLGLECFFLAWFTAVRTYKIVKGYFGGGNNE